MNDELGHTVTVRAQARLARSCGPPGHDPENQGPATDCPGRPRNAGAWQCAWWPMRPARSGGGRLDRTSKSSDKDVSPGCHQHASNLNSMPGLDGDQERKRQPTGMVEVRSTPTPSMMRPSAGLPSSTPRPSNSWCRQGTGPARRPVRARTQGAVGGQSSESVNTSPGRCRRQGATACSNRPRRAWRGSRRRPGSRSRCPAPAATSRCLDDCARRRRGWSCSPWQCDRRHRATIEHGSRLR